MSNLRPFQIFALAIFGFLGILSVVLLSTFSPGVNQEEFAYGDSVVIWGTLDYAAFRETFLGIGKDDKSFERAVSYEEIDERRFDDILVSAIAEGRGPDLVLLPSTELVRQRDRLLALSYETFPMRDFRDWYVDGAEIYARPDGVYAIPMFVDPLMMYWNRDIFATGGLAEAPTTWEYVVNYVVPSLTLRDNRRNILRASLPFGEVQNVRNAKETLLTLALQSGSPLVVEDNGRYKVEFNESTQEGLPPFEAAVQFYVGFSNPNSTLYTWNRSQPLDRNAFVAGDLAMYIGFASELPGLREQNPNLNFDITQIPQGASATVRRTYGEFYGLAILKTSQNQAGAYRAARLIASPAISGQLSESLDIAPVSRSVLAQGSTDPYRNSMLGAALTARGWLDPDSNETRGIFATLVEDINSGRSSLNSAIKDALQRIRLTF